MPFGPFKKITKPISSAIKGVTGLVDDVAGIFGGSSAKEIAAGTLSHKGGKESRELQIAQALNQMQFQEASSARQYERTKALAQTAYDRAKYLSDTAWQRGMADMKKAGINPILAYKQGPASTPSIQMGSVGLQSGAMAPINDIITPAIQSAQNVKQTAAQVNKFNAEVDLMEKKGVTEIYKAGLTRQQTKATIAAFKKTVQETLNLQQVYEIQTFGIGKAEAEQQIAKVLAGNATASGATNISQLLPGLMGQFGRFLEKVLPKIFEAPKY